MTTVGLPPTPPVRKGRAWTAPAVSAVAAGAGCALLALVDPGEPGRYPVCPFRMATGLWCPACGSLRGLHALIHGNLAQAASFNVLLLAVLPVAGYAWLVWASPRFGGPRLPRPRVAPPVWWGLLAVALAFGVLRNLTAFSFVAP